MYVVDGRGIAVCHLSAMFNDQGLYAVKPDKTQSHWKELQSILMALKMALCLYTSTGHAMVGSKDGREGPWASFCNGREMARTKLDKEAWENPRETIDKIALWLLNLQVSLWGGKNVRAVMKHELEAEPIRERWSHWGWHKAWELKCDHYNLEWSELFIRG